MKNGFQWQGLFGNDRNLYSYTKHLKACACQDMNMTAMHWASRVSSRLKQINNYGTACSLSFLIIIHCNAMHCTVFKIWTLEKLQQHQCTVSDVWEMRTWDMLVSIILSHDQRDNRQMRENMKYEQDWYYLQPDPFGFHALWPKFCVEMHDWRFNMSQIENYFSTD